MRKIRLRVEFDKLGVGGFDRAFFEKFPVALQRQNELIYLSVLAVRLKPQRSLEHLVTLDPRVLVFV